MSADPFANANVAQFGADLARAWQDSLDTWWKSLLGDPARLRQLAEQMTGLGAQTGSRQVDPAQVLTALELLEHRMAELEGQVKTLAESLSLVVRHLEGAGKGRDS